MITAIFLSLMATSAAAQETLIKRSDFLSAVATNILEIRLLSLQLKVLDSGEITGKAFGQRRYRILGVDRWILLPQHDLGRPRAGV